MFSSLQDSLRRRGPRRPVADPPPPEPRTPLHEVVDRLPRREGRTAVVLVDEALRPAVLKVCLGALKGVNVTLLGATGHLPPWAATVSSVASTCAEDDLAWFVGGGPADIVVDLRHPRAGARRTRWTQFFLYLRTEGAWVVPRLSTARDLRDTERDWLIALAREAGAPGVDDPVAEVMHAVATVTARADMVVIEKRHAHLVKLRDEEIMTVLPRRDPQISVELLAERPAQVFRSPARITSHPSAVPIKDLDTTIPVPPMSLRHYRGPIAFSGQTLMFAEHSVLADSFRFYHALDDVRGVLANRNLLDIDARLARVRPGKTPTETLEGDYYQLDPQSTGHFGHIMTEVVARLWGWDEAKARMPGLKALLWTNPPPTGKRALGDAASTGLQHQLLNAYGIADEDIVCRSTGRSP